MKILICLPQHANQEAQTVRPLLFPISLIYRYIIFITQNYISVQRMHEITVIIKFWTRIPLHM